MDTASVRHRTRRQTELLDRLIELFLTEGFAHLTLEDLAARLHCSKSTLYALADSKEQLTVAVVVHFFRRAADRVEQRIVGVSTVPARVAAYLAAVADELRPASPEFFADLARSAPAREVYERNIRIAADRIRALVVEGVDAGVFREVHAAFVAEVVAATMARILRGEIAQTTGLSDAEAYAELAGLVLHGVATQAATHGATPPA